MSTMYKSRMPIGGKMKTVVVINHDSNTKATENKSVDTLHHIHILDRSGSMSGSIRQLIENVKSTIKYIPEGDYVSIIWFSSAGQYKTLIKGARKDESLYKLLDSIASTLGCTCFSEALEEVGVIIDDLAAICPNFNVTLFTDGQPVTPWSTAEEIGKMMFAIDKWKDKVIALNTVGYSNYYDEKLLKSVAEKSQFGQFVHASKINDYMNIFSHNYERVSELCVENVKIELEDDVPVMFIGDKSTILNNDGLIKLSRIEKKRNQFVIIADVDNFAIYYNEDKILTKNITKEIPSSSITPILYAYAYNLYYKGERQAALDILAKDIKDKMLIDKQLGAFTFDEVSEYTKFLQRAVFKKSSRYMWGEAPDGYLPADDALCVMDLLRLLVLGENMYVYASDYNRIGLATVDNFNLFRKEEGEVRTYINELVFNKEQLNISIRSIIPGHVSINPVRAKQVGLPTTIPSKIYRNQTIIKDGNLNMDEITIWVDDGTFIRLTNWNSQVAFFSSVPEYVASIGKTKVTLNLSKLPVINRLYLKEAGDINTVLSSAYNMVVLEAKQKVLNYLIKKTKESENLAEGEFVKYTDEQIEVLKEHGLDKNLNYVGIDTEMAEKNEQDYYEARNLSFQIKGMASIPGVDKAIAGLGYVDGLKGVTKIMAEFIKYLNIDIEKLSSTAHSSDAIEEKLFDLDSLQVNLKEIKRKLLDERLLMFSTKISKILTGDWFPELVPDNKGGYTYTSGDKTLVVSADKVKCYF